ncbi:MAG: hypothetical protein WC976_06445 [Caldisericia bacterium]
MKKMSVEDVGKVVRAIAVLEKLNKKYGEPHGPNLFGIIPFALGTVKDKLAEGKEHVKK